MVVSSKVKQDLDLDLGARRNKGGADTFGKGSIVWKRESDREEHRRQSCLVTDTRIRGRPLVVQHYAQFTGRRL